MKSHEQWARDTKRRFKIGGGAALLGFLLAFFGDAVYVNGEPIPGGGLMVLAGMLFLVGGFVYLFLGIFDTD